MERVKFIKKPRLRNPYLICAWPGMGEVAFKAATYLVEKLQAEEFACIAPEPFFYLTGSTIKDGLLSIPELPSSKFYFWKNKSGRNDLIIFLSNAQPDLIRAEEYCGLINYVAKSFKTKLVIGFAAMPLPIDHTQASGVWFVATSEELKEELRKKNLNLLAQGQISGMNGLYLGLAKKEGLQGFCLLGEVPLYTIQIENPKASYAALEALVRVLDIKIDLKPLFDQTQAIEGEINKLLDHLRLGEAVGPIGEDEIEKIKKTLSHLTSLPFSIKDKIEKLFVQAKIDISKANELKGVLDKWNVYKEYEDEFLDLFKKDKKQNN